MICKCKYEFFDVFSIFNLLTDMASLRDFKGVVAYLVYGNNNAQRQYGDNAIYTMNAEQIENGLFI